MKLFMYHFKYMSMRTIFHMWWNYLRVSDTYYDSCEFTFHELKSDHQAIQAQIFQTGFVASCGFLYAQVAHGLLISCASAVVNSSDFVY